MTMLAVMAVLGVNTVLGANAFADAPVDGAQTKDNKIHIDGDVRIRFDGQNEHGIFINAPFDNVKLMINGKEETFSKGLHEVHFSKESIEEAQRLQLVDVNSIPGLQDEIDRNEVANTFFRGLEGESFSRPGHGFNVGGYNYAIVGWYEYAKKPLGEEENDSEVASYKVDEARVNLYTRRFLLPIPFAFHIPEHANRITAAKHAYEAWKQYKADIIKNHPEIKDAFIGDNRLVGVEEVEDNTTFSYDGYREGLKLPEYMYHLQQMYALRGEKKSSTSYRVRVNATADLNDHTKASIRLVREGGFGTGVQTRTEVDRLWIGYQFGKSQVQVGRIGTILGDGLVFEGSLDGIVGSTKLGKVNVALGYGRPKDLATNVKELGQTIIYGQLQMPITNHISGKLYMASLNSYTTPNDRLTKLLVGNYVGFHHRIYGIAFTGDYGRFGWNAEYAKRTEGEDNAMTLPLLREGKGRNAWMLGARYTYGKATVGAQYFYLGQNSPILVSSVYDTRYTKNWKGFVTTLDYAFNTHMLAKVGYISKGSPVETFHGAVAPAAKYFAQVEYKF